MALTFPLAEAKAPLYQGLAPEITKRRLLGLSLRRIAKPLGIDDKTVEKSLRSRAGRRVGREACETGGCSGVTSASRPARL
jgi:hypothetical protein